MTKRKKSTLKGVRTQITLPAGLKRRIELLSDKKDISLAEFLRQAAEQALVQSEEKQADLEKLVNQLQECVEKDKHPDWANKDWVNRWLKLIR